MKVQTNSFGQTWRIHKDVNISIEDPPEAKRLQGVHHGFTVCIPIEEMTKETSNRLRDFQFKCKLFATGTFKALYNYEEDVNDDITECEACFWFEHKSERDRAWEQWIVM
jgi:hypothetical protein